MRHSKSDYPENWKEIAKCVKDEAGWKCVRCGAQHQPGRVLTVHHLDIDPQNCEWWNLAALCQQCHLHIQGKVVMEQPYMFEHSAWFKPYAAGYYAKQNNLPTDKAWVLGHIDELLEYGHPTVFERTLP